MKDTKDTICFALLAFRASPKTPFTRYSRLSNGFDNRVERTALFVQPVVTLGCTIGLTTGCIHDTAVLSNRLLNGFDNRLNVWIDDTTGCQTTLTTGCIVYTNIYPVVKTVWQPVLQQVVSCKRGLTTRNRMLEKSVTKWKFWNFVDCHEDLGIYTWYIPFCWFYIDERLFDKLNVRRWTVNIGPVSYIRISLCYFCFRWQGICCLQIYNRLI